MVPAGAVVVVRGAAVVVGRGAAVVVVAAAAVVVVVPPSSPPSWALAVQVLPQARAPLTMTTTRARRCRSRFMSPPS